MPLRWQRFPDRFTIILVSISAILLVLELVNDRFWLNDFRVYYDAATAFRNGDAVYGVAHGLDSGYFKYAPAMAMLYVPLSLLPYSIVAIIQYALIVTAFVGSVITADRLLRTHVLGGRHGTYAPIFFATLVTVVHLHRELHLGNINVLLVWLLVHALDRMLSGRVGAAGFLIGIAILAKPHFVVLLPLLLLRGHFRAATNAVFVAVIALLLPLLFIGTAKWIVLHGQWLNEMARHNASMIYTGGDAYNNVDTVYSFLHRAVLKHLSMAHFSEVLLVVAALALVFGAVVLLDLKRERTVGCSPANTVFEYFILMALVPSITLTDTNHFLFSMPLVLLIVNHIVVNLRSWTAMVAIPMLLLYGGNWADALGGLSDRMVHYGVLGIANLGLIAIGCVLLLRRSNHPIPQASSISTASA